MVLETKRQTLPDEDLNTDPQPLFVTFQVPCEAPLSVSCPNVSTHILHLHPNQHCRTILCCQACLFKYRRLIAKTFIQSNMSGIICTVCDTQFTHDDFFTAALLPGAPHE